MLSRACARALLEARQSGPPAQWLRAFAAPSWPAEVPTPAGAKPFDPSGPLSQVDNLADGLPHDDPFVKLALDMKNLRVAVDKLKAEEATRSDGVPPGLATGKDGDIDEAYYTQTQGFHPDFVKELRSAMQEEAKTHPKPAKDDSWEKCIAMVQPLVEEEQARLVKQLEEVRAKEKQLAEFEERLEEITVNEMLERHPDLAQEIKDEIEAGVWHPTDAGYKIESGAVATDAKAH